MLAPKELLQIAYFNKSPQENLTHSPIPKASEREAT
jgi:hypothetical protein